MSGTGSDPYDAADNRDGNEDVDRDVDAVGDGADDRVVDRTDDRPDDGRDDDGEWADEPGDGEALTGAEVLGDSGYREVALATISQRAVGRFVDYILTYFLLNLALVAPFAHTVTNSKGDKVYEFDTPIGIRILAIALPLLYEVGFVAWRGQTIGKLIAKIKVVRDGTDVRPPFVSAALRALVPAVLATFLGPLIGILVVAAFYFTALMNPNRQGLHDRLAHTLVIEA